MYATISWPKDDNKATCAAANHFFPDQHPKVWWPIDDMHINRVDIFKYVSREKCEGKNVCVSSVL